MRWLYTLTPQEKKEIAQKADRLGDALVAALPGSPPPRAVARDIYANMRWRLAQMKLPEEEREQLTEAFYLICSRNQQGSDRKVRDMFKQPEEWRDIIGCSLRDILSDEVLTRRFREEKVPVFEEAMLRESKKRGFVLGAWTRQMQARGHAGFNAQELFDKTGVAEGRVIAGNPIVVPYYGDFQFHARGGTKPWQPIDGGIELNGYCYGFGFAGRFLHDRDNDRKILWKPAIYIDASILDELEQGLATEGQEQRTAQTVLSGLHSLFLHSIHDYVHQSLYGYVFYEDKQPEQRGEDPYGAGYSFTGGINTPISVVSKSAGAVGGSQLNSPWSKRGGQVLRTRLSSLEAHAEMLQRDVMQGQFGEAASPYKHQGANTKDYGARIKGNIVRQATEYLDALEDFRSVTVARRGEEAANNMVSYLSTLALGRFFRVVAMDDEALNTPCTLTNGKAMSFRQAADALRLPPFALGKHFNTGLLNENPALRMLAYLDRTQPPEESEAAGGKVAHLMLLFPEWEKFAEKAGICADASTLGVAMRAVGAIHRLWPAGNNYKELSRIAKDLLHCMQTPQQSNALVSACNANSLRDALASCAFTEAEQDTAMRVFQRLGKTVRSSEEFLDAALFVCHWREHPFLLKQVEQWLPGGFSGDFMERMKDVQLTGFDAVRARVLFEGSAVPGWLPDLKRWDDERYSTAEVCEEYRQGFAENAEILARPVYARKLKEYGEYVAGREKGRG